MSDPGRSPRLHGWLAPPVLNVALVMMAAGFGQFAAVAALGDVAEEFGDITGDATIAEQAGLSGTVLGLSPAVTATMVVGAGATGLAGLMAGRWGADRFGRRLCGAVALCAIAGTGVLTYSGTVPAVVTGYLLAVGSGSAFAPAAGALAAELFPTEVRASVTGWTVGAGVLGSVTGLLAFGAVADIGGRFSQAAMAVFVPVSLASVLFAMIPETQGRELEEWDRP